MLSSLVLLCCIPAVSAGNIFVVSVLTGSHLSAPYDVAAELASAGHNVTFVCLVSGGRVPFSHPNITVLELRGAAHKKELDELMQGCVIDIAEQDSSKMMVMVPRCRETWQRVLENAQALIKDPELTKVMSKANLVIAEMAGPVGVSAMAAMFQVPVVEYVPSFLTFPGSLLNNLPTLLFSQPSPLLLGNFHLAPTFFERLHRLYEMLRFNLQFWFMFAASQQKVEQLLGVSGKESVKMILTNDQDVMTFPFLRAPNDIQVGAISLLNTASPPLPMDLAEFISPGAILVTFGSYAAIDQFGWYKKLVGILEGLGKRVVIKAASPPLSSPDILSLDWVPQRALLASGKVELFISHCGNNGRLETIFYEVPVLCIPLFADQDLNAELIRFKGFGEKVWKEHVGREGEGAIRALLERAPEYRARMGRAVGLVRRSGIRERLLLHIEELIELGNLDHLVNPVILQQNSFQVLGLDILALTGVLLLSLLGLILFVLFQCGRALCRRMGKSKQE